MAGLGLPELLLVVGVIVLLFGAKKLPEFARSLGHAKQEFKRGIDEQPVTPDEIVVVTTEKVKSA